ncbi:MAG: hypothetical protein WCK91_03340 [bacterium]
MRFTKKVRRLFDYFFRDSIPFQRLARLNAYRLNGQMFEVLEVFPAETSEEGGFFLRLRDPREIERHVMIYADRRVEISNGRVRVRYNPQPEEKMLGIYGRMEYLNQPTTYLRAIPV